MVDVPLIENYECEDWHERAGITVQLYPEMMCAGYRYNYFSSICATLNTEILF